VPTITKRGTSQYLARIRLTGYPTFSKTFSTRRAAMAWAVGHEKAILENGDDALKRESKLTLSAAFTRYGQEVTPQKKGKANELSYIKRWQLNPIVALPLAKIRGADVARYRDARLAEGKSGNTIRLELALLSHVYEVARKDWGMETLINPVKAIRKPKVARGRDRRLHPGEEAKLLAYCADTGNLRLAASITLCIETAMRRSELVGLKWSEVNRGTRMVYLDDTKNGESRTVPLSSRALAAVDTLPEAFGLLVIGYPHPDTLTWHFVRACKACGIEGLRLHDLRHEATSRLFEKGFNIMEVSTITGHKSLSMLKRYTHLKPSTLLDRLG
jgi:integrase